VIHFEPPSNNLSPFISISSPPLNPSYVFHSVNNPREKPSGGLLGSKWAIPSLDVLKSRRARGLHATFKEEQEEVSEMKSGPFYII
jgi:hypothetical protein